MLKNIRQSFRERGIYYGYFPITWYTSRVAFFFYGFPRNRKDVIEELSGAGFTEDDLGDYKFSLKLQSSHKIYLALNLLIGIKNLYLPYYIVSSISELNLEYSTLTTRSLKYGCLITNCTSRLAYEQLTSFPIFSLCKQKYNWFYWPLSHIHQMGVSLTCICTYFIILLNILLMLYLYISPTHVETHLFAHLPHIGMRLKCEEIRRSLTRVYLSMINFHSQNSRLLYLDTSPVISSKRSSDRAGRRRLGHRANNINFEHKQLSRFNTEYMRLDKFAIDYIEDCLPLFRSPWFHPRSVEIYCTGSFAFVGVLVIYISCGLVLLDYFLDLEAEKLMRTLEQFSSESCEVRFNNGKVLERYDLVRVFPHWNISNSIELTIFFLPAFYFCGITLSWYQHGLFDLGSMIVEQMDRVSFALEISNRLRATSLYKAQGEACSDEVQSYSRMYSFDHLKRMHMQDPNLGAPFGPFPYSWDGRRDSCLRARQIAASLVRANGISLVAYQELLTKIYASNCSLIRTTSSLHINAQKILTISFAITYGSIAILIFMNGKLGVVNNFTLYIGFSAIIVNSAMVFLPSKIYSTSRRLIKLEWKLMVASMDLEDMRIKHLRCLIMKQIKEFCDDGGGSLAIRAYGIPLRYGFVIKLALWSATMTVISFSLSGG